MDREQQSEKSQQREKKSADRSGKYFSTPETWTVECNCRRIFANIWFSQVWKHSSYTYAIPWCFKIWAWLRHEFLETTIPWWFTGKFWPRHELGMSLSFDCRSFSPVSWPVFAGMGGPSWVVVWTVLVQLCARIRRWRSWRLFHTHTQMQRQSAWRVVLGCCWLKFRLIWSNRSVWMK